MKPKTALQRRVAELTAKTLPLTEKQKQWAMGHIFPKKAYKSKAEVWCSECGRIFPYTAQSDLGLALTGDTIVCPGCGEKLSVEHSRKKKDEKRVYYQILETHGEFQVVRNFTAHKYCHEGQMPHYRFTEVFQNWISPQGKETIYARPVVYMHGRYDWVHSKAMEIRVPRQSWGMYYDPDRYNAHSWIYPYAGVSGLVRRNGFTVKCDTLPANVLIKLLLTDHEAETLIKARQYALLGMKYRRGLADGLKTAVKIAIRHNYIVRDDSMWKDYIDLLEYFGKDLHNPLYVCPKNLKREHDKLLKRKRRIEEQRLKERKAAEALRNESMFRESKAAYFGLVFGNEKIRVSVIGSLEEMRREGDALHHCVFYNEYYKRKDALILSARDSAGNRLETVEVSLKSFDIVQCRGINNSNTEWHEEIMNLVMENMGLIRERSLLSLKAV